MTTTHQTILLIEHDQGTGGVVRHMLESEQHVVKSVARPEEARAFIQQGIHQGVDLVLCELRADRDAAFEFVSWLSEQNRQPPLILLVETGDVDSAVQGMKLGAADCLTVPVDPLRLRLAVAKWALSPANSESANRNDLAPAANNTPSVRSLDIPAGTSLEKLERAAVEQALANHGGNRTHAAQQLGISVRTLQRKLKTWGPPVRLFQGDSIAPPMFRQTYSTPLTFSV
jgi:DNA-binding NtrC family response regulator